MVWLLNVLGNDNLLHLIQHRASYFLSIFFKMVVVLTVEELNNKNCAESRLSISSFMERLEWNGNAAIVSAFVFFLQSNLACWMIDVFNSYPIGVLGEQTEFIYDMVSLSNNVPHVSAPVFDIVSSIFTLTSILHQLLLPKTTVGLLLS